MHGKRDKIWQGPHIKGPEPKFSNLGCNLCLSIYLDNIVQGYQSALFVLQAKSSLVLQKKCVICLVLY